MASDDKNYMVFSIENTKFALEPASVFNVFRYPETVLPYPGQKKLFTGIIEINEISYPLINPVQLEIKEISANKYVIIIQFKKKKAALAADEVYGILKELPPEAVFISL